MQKKIFIWKEYTNQPHGVLFEYKNLEIIDVMQVVNPFLPSEVPVPEVPAKGNRKQDKISQ